MILTKSQIAIQIGPAPKVSGRFLNSKSKEKHRPILIGSSEVTDKHTSQNAFAKLVENATDP